MGARNDYRVSKIIVLCKDCGNDVGLYPARHQCTNVQRLPTLCCSTNSTPEEENVPDLVANTPTSVKRQASDSSIESGKWSFFSRTNSSTSPVKVNKQDEEATSYFDTYANNLKTSSSFTDISDINSAQATGKKLWGRMKENEKWKELIADSNKKKEDITSKTSSGKLWQRIIHATVSNTVEYHDSGAESDDEDWEGETHVSRILREYHENKNTPLPTWLYDDRTPVSTTASLPAVETMQRSKTLRGRRRLWQQDDNDNMDTSAREKERQALRANTMTRTQSERFANSNKPTIQQRSSLRDINYHKSNDDNDPIVYGSIAPRRTNTTSRVSNNNRKKTSYLDHNYTTTTSTLARSATISKQKQKYFF